MLKKVHVTEKQQNNIKKITSLKSQSMDNTKPATGRKSLPKMNSIWIDEDQEEKLYNIQAQVMLNDDNSNDDLQNIMFLNSKTPLLNNKKNIELPPLDENQGKTGKTPKNAKVNQKTKGNSQEARISTMKLLKLFGSRKETKPLTISTPFDFQHISHANGFSSAAEAREVERHELKRETLQTPRASIDLTQVALQSPVRLSTKPNYHHSSSSRSSSKFSESPSGSSGIMSNFTVDTSVDEVSVELLTTENKDDDSVYLNDLKNYNFPSIISQSLDNMQSNSSKENSTSKLTSEDPSPTDIAPSIGKKQRISVDDILRFYSGNSNSRSSTQASIPIKGV